MATTNGAITECDGAARVVGGDACLRAQTRRPSAGLARGLAWLFTAAALIVASFVVFSPRGAVAETLSALAKPSAYAYATSPTLERLSDGRVRFELELSEKLESAALVLAEPHRLVVDFPEIAWRLSAEKAADLTAPGVLGVRFGLFRVGRSRLVIDLEAPPQVLRRVSTPATQSTAATFTLEFVLGDGLRQRAAATTTRTPAIGAAARGFARENAPNAAPKPLARPKPIVIAIDAGHGGVDPGASYGGVSEKELTLTFAQEAKDAIMRAGAFKVIFTRAEDEYVQLAERVARARARGADLFLSVHADALPQRPDVSGASVYTLALDASDALAAELARRENAADAIAGVAMPAQDDDVRTILVDLAKQRASIESERVAALLVEELQGRVPVLKSRPHRRANFAVLRTFDMPAALIELGFLTNLRDRRRLTNPAWREQAAEAIAMAVRRWTRAEIRVATSHR